MTAARREGKGARVWRKVPSEDQMFVRTLDGKLGILSKCCPSCGETKALGQFYFKGISKRIDMASTVNQHERICVTCWDEKKLSQKRRREEDPANTVMNFIGDE